MEDEMSKKCTPLWREANFEVKMYNTSPPLGALLEVEMLENVRRCGTKQISKTKCTKHDMFAPLLDVEASFCVAGAGVFSTLPKVSKTVFGISKNDGGRGAFEGSAKIHIAWQTQYKSHVHQRC